MLRSELLAPGAVPVAALRPHAVPAGPTDHLHAAESLSPSFLPAPLAAAGRLLIFLAWLYLLWVTALSLSAFRTQRRGLLANLARNAQDALWRHERHGLAG